MSKEVTKNKKEVEKKASIEIAEHPEFEGTMKTKTTSSIELARVVSSLFAPAFSDYCGCKIRVMSDANMANALGVPYGALYVDLFFKDQGPANENSWKNILPRGTVEEGDPNDLGARFAKVNGAKNGRAYQVTKKTYEALEEFAFNNMVRWNNHTQEISSQTSVYGKEEAIVCISGLSLDKIITKIYGKKTKEGFFEYMATPSTVIPNRNQEFIIQVFQLDNNAVRELQNTLGLYSSNAPLYHSYNAN